MQYPEQKAYLAPRYRGRIILSRDPDGGERCVACHLCAVVCPVDCIALQATEDENGRRFPEWFRINFSRCIFCGFCEDACPTYAIQLTPDVEMSEYHRPEHGLRERTIVDQRSRKISRLQLLARVRVSRSAGRKRRGRDTRRPPTDFRSSNAISGLWMHCSMSRRWWPFWPR